MNEREEELKAYLETLKTYPMSEAYMAKQDKPMQPSVAIDGLDTAMSGWFKVQGELMDQCRDVMRRWDRLKEIGAQREDMAAELLGTLRPYTEKVSGMFARVSKAIEAMEKDPFGFER